ncbi:DUF6146 family protein [Prolixibacteraceae bacterium Z1-6]|uniref:DUF6146 family protein n=1 Tax=Draconibacterium aestuarii TaxID=2998507 RepID=A0A9X3FBR9_9BACT|nr:DUF6146 family protein [Prolixibacteraceae bacterium Z1-6]
MKTRKIIKRIFFILAVVGFVYACSSQKKAIRVNKTDDVVAAEDSLEYEVETFDARFDTWYQFYNSPAMYRSQPYYENWNRQYVPAWNHRCMHPVKGWNFDPVVGYDPTEDYGFELNHKLFHYFMYVENVLKLKILPNGPTLPLH